MELYHAVIRFHYQKNGGNLILQFIQKSLLESEQSGGTV